MLVIAVGDAKNQIKCNTISATSRHPKNRHISFFDSVSKMSYVVLSSIARESLTAVMVLFVYI